MDRIFVVAMASVMVLTGSATAAPSASERGVRATLFAYQDALNDSDVDRIIALYTDDGVFMAQHRAPAVGRAAVTEAYQTVLSVIDLDIAFIIDEVEVLGDTAWARTRSAGTTTILANGAEVTEGNQELFLLRRQGGEWRIARYIFSTTQPR